MRKHFMFKVLLTLVVGLFLSVGAFAQQIAIKGIVKDTTGEPVIGANVLVKGTTNGTITDFDGNFQLSANKGDIIVVSFIGYTAQELPATAELMNIILKDDSEMLSEVVVIGYGVAKKNDLTGSVTAMKPDEMNKGLVTNAQDMMQGKIAGVNVTSASGTPGAGAQIRIRGGSSLNASNDPLIVIDGLAMDNSGVQGLSNPLSMVNPNDIETFTVLKDASATAIYGSRGSNGVIIITTKKGKSGAKPTVNYSGNVSVSTKKKTIEVMDGNEFRQFVTEMYGEGSDAVNTLGTANTDWQSEIYRAAISTDHNITLSGGLKNMPYRATVGYTNQQGILKTSNFERFTASLNLSPSLLEDHLKLNLNAKGMIANTRYANTSAVNAAVWMDPTQSIYDSRDEYKNFGGYFQWTSNGAALNDPNWPITYNTLATKNPVALLDHQDDNATSKTFIGNAEFDYKVHGFEDLRLHMNLGADYSTGKQTTIISPYSSTNHYYGWDGWTETDKYNLLFTAYAQYMKDFNEANHFDIMGGYEWQHFHREGMSNGWGYYQDTNTEKPGQKTEHNANNNPWATENYLVSFFGRANYSLLDRYMLTATVRYDGSSRFKDHWALFPSFAFGWRIKEEAFLKDVEVLSDLKLRLGYGQTGQQEGIGDYNYFASYNVNTSVDSYYPLIDNGQLNRPNAYNNDLTWETTTTYNAGIDFGFLNGRLTGNIDWYYRETTDLLNTVSVAAGSNFRNQVMSNIGSLKNTGIEASLNWKAISNNDWLWDLGVNFTYNQNEITELVDGDYQLTGGISSGTGNMCQAHAVGHPAGSFYVYQQVYDNNGMPIEGAVVDRNGDGTITTADKYLYKSPSAPWTAGFTSKLMYKNWDFSFSLRASFDNYVFNDLEAGSSNISSSQVLAQSGYLSNRPKNVLAKAWQTYDWVLSDYFVQNASFLKCDNITLGYTFDKLFGAKIGGRVYATASNVFTITDYKGIDPEVAGGIDNSIYPRPFTALLGLSLNF